MKFPQYMESSYIYVLLTLLYPILFPLVFLIASSTGRAMRKNSSSAIVTASFFNIIHMAGSDALIISPYTNWGSIYIRNQAFGAGFV
jgi:hypothetical protein